MFLLGWGECNFKEGWNETCKYHFHLKFDPQERRKNQLFWILILKENKVNSSEKVMWACQESLKKFENRCFHNLILADVLCKQSLDKKGYNWRSRYSCTNETPSAWIYFWKFCAPNICCLIKFCLLLLTPDWWHVGGHWQSRFCDERLGEVLQSLRPVAGSNVIRRQEVGVYAEQPDQLFVLSHWICNHY